MQPSGLCRCLIQQGLSANVFFRSFYSEVFESTAGVLGKPPELQKRCWYRVHSWCSGKTISHHCRDKGLVPGGGTSSLVMNNERMNAKIASLPLIGINTSFDEPLHQHKWGCLEFSNGIKVTQKETNVQKFMFPTSYSVHVFFVKAREQFGSVDENVSRSIALARTEISQQL